MAATAETSRPIVAVGPGAEPGPPAVDALPALLPDPLPQPDRRVPVDDPAPAAALAYSRPERVKPVLPARGAAGGADRGPHQGGESASAPPPGTAADDAGDSAAAPDAAPTAEEAMGAGAVTGAAVEASVPAAASPGVGLAAADLGPQVEIVRVVLSDDRRTRDVPAVSALGRHPALGADATTADAAEVIAAIAALAREADALLPAADAAAHAPRVVAVPAGAARTASAPHADAVLADLAAILQRLPVLTDVVADGTCSATRPEARVPDRG